ncbi:hypothetical protein DFH07DRAFT_784530, partial [Mycena maculata]
VITLGAENVIPEIHHATTTSILTQEDLGIPRVDWSGYAPSALNADAGRRPGKIIVYTMLAKFHDKMTEFLESAGIGTIFVNGHIEAGERHKRIGQFEKDPRLTVLIISGVGSTGLNLTAANVVILYDLTWSAVTAQQIHARIHRQGQTSPTWAIQMVATDTFEVLLATIGLGKGSMASQFLDPARHLEYYTPLAAAAAQSVEGEDNDPPPDDSQRAEPPSKPPGKRPRSSSSKPRAKRPRRTNDGDLVDGPGWGYSSPQEGPASEDPTPSSSRARDTPTTSSEPYAPSGGEQVMDVDEPVDDGVPSPMDEPGYDSVPSPVDEPGNDGVASPADEPVPAGYVPTPEEVFDGILADYGWTPGSKEFHAFYHTAVSNVEIGRRWKDPSTKSRETQIMLYSCYAFVEVYAQRYTPVHPRLIPFMSEGSTSANDFPLRRRYRAALRRKTAARIAFNAQDQEGELEPADQQQVDEDHELCIAYQLQFPHIDLNQEFVADDGDALDDEGEIENPHSQHDAREMDEVDAYDDPQLDFEAEKIQGVDAYDDPELDFEADADDEDGMNVDEDDGLDAVPNNASPSPVAQHQRLVPIRKWLAGGVFWQDLMPPGAADESPRASPSPPEKPRRRRSRPRQRIESSDSGSETRAASVDPVPSPSSNPYVKPTGRPTTRRNRDASSFQSRTPGSRSTLISSDDETPYEAQKWAGREHKGKAGVRKIILPDKRRPGRS